MDQNRKYIAFISYRHKPRDTALAAALHKMLERYVIPKEFRVTPEQKHLGLVFRDREELPLSDDLTEDIYTALDNAQFLIVICSNDTPESIWVRREIEYFTARHGHNRVLAVLAEEPPSKSFPDVLTKIVDSMGNVIDEVEPLAAYAVGKNRLHSLYFLRKDLMRLIAAILGKPYGALMQRQKRYRQKRLTAALSLVLAVAAGFIGMLINRNAEIAYQLEQAQINESTALALYSTQQLENGDRLGAIDSALQALPTDQNRPYLPQAEAALVNALYLYQPPAMCNFSQITQQSDIYNIVHTQDGRYLITLDKFGVLRCYDSATQALLWQNQVLSNKHFLSPYSPQLSLEILEVHEAVFAMGKVYRICDGSYIGMLNASEYTLNFDDDAFSVDGTLRAIQNCSSVGDSLSDRAYSYDVIFQDTLTGQAVAHTAPLPLNTYYHSASKGSFSADGRTYTAVYWSETLQAAPAIAMQIDTQTAEILWTYKIPYGKNPACIALNDGSAYIYLQNKGKAQILHVSGEGKVLNSIYFECSGEEALACINAERNAYFVFDRYVAAIGPTGYFVITLTEKCISAFPAEDGGVMISLEDGRIRHLGFGEEGYYDTLYYELEEPVVWAYITYDTISYIPSKSMEHCTILRRLGDSERKPVPYTCKETKHTLYYTTQIYPMPDNRRFLAFCYYPGYDHLFHGFSRDTYVLSIYDGDTLSIQEQYCFEGGYGNELYLTGISSDGTKVFLENYVYDFSAEVLCKLDDNKVKTANSNGSTPVISACYNGDTNELQWWLDGTPSGAATCPYEGCYDLEAVFSQGYVVLTEYAENPITGDNMIGYLLFNINDRVWIPICPAIEELNGSEAAVGATKPIFALIDAAGALCIYDIESSTVIARHELDLTASTLGALQFILDDSVILLCDGNNHKIRFISVETGELLAAFPFDYPYDLTYQIDDSNQCIYLGDKNGKSVGLKISLIDWTSTAKIPNLSCYIDSQKLICWDTSEETIYRIPVHSLDDIISMGHSLLSQNSN